MPRTATPPLTKTTRNQDGNSVGTTPAEQTGQPQNYCTSSTSEGKKQKKTKNIISREYGPRGQSGCVKPAWLGDKPSPHCPCEDCKTKIAATTPPTQLSKDAISRQMQDRARDWCGDSHNNHSTRSRTFQQIDRVFGLCLDTVPLRKERPLFIELSSEPTSFCKLVQAENLHSFEQVENWLTDHSSFLPMEVRSGTSAARELEGHILRTRLEDLDADLQRRDTKKAATTALARKNSFEVARSPAYEMKRALDGSEYDRLSKAENLDVCKQLATVLSARTRVLHLYAEMAGVDPQREFQDDRM